VILESQLAEEPFVLARLVALLKFALNLNPGLSSLCFVFDDVTSCNILVELNVNKVTGWHKVCVVVTLDEGLHAAPLLPVLLFVFSIDWFWIPVDAGDNCMSIALVRVTIIVVLQDNSFSSSISAGQYDDHLAWFHNFSHLEEWKFL